MKKILTDSGHTFVDDEDYDWLNQYQWNTVLSGDIRYRYIVLSENNNQLEDGMYYGMPISRLILGLKYGDPRQADHINHNVRDNQRSNLRICTSTQNHGNQKIRAGGTSRYKGVYWKKHIKKWVAQIKIERKIKYLGVFDSERTAAFAYNLAAKKHFKKFALLNKI